MNVHKHFFNLFKISMKIKMLKDALPWLLCSLSSKLPLGAASWEKSQASLLDSSLLSPSKRGSRKVVACAHLALDKKISCRHTIKRLFIKKAILYNVLSQKKQSRLKSNIFVQQEKSLLRINDPNTEPSETRRLAAKAAKQPRRTSYPVIILRPLLKFSRLEFMKFCEFWYLPILPDLTNFNVGFRRNCLRLNFIPYFKIFFNLNLFKKIDQFQQILNIENQYFQLFLQKILFKDALPLAACSLSWKHGEHGVRQACPSGEPGRLRTPAKAASSQGERKRGMRQAWALGARAAQRRARRLRHPRWGAQAPLLRKQQAWGAQAPWLAAGAAPPPLAASPLEPPWGLRLGERKRPNFFHFPKIFQYLIIYHFYFLSNKKISFNEIYCIFQKLKNK